MLKTKEALQNLERLLCCDICEKTLQYPMSLTSCDHTYCRGCIEDHLGEPCPKCRLPCNKKDVRLDTNLWNVIKICQRMQKLINDYTHGESLTNEEVVPADVLEMPTDVIDGAHVSIQATRESKDALESADTATSISVKYGDAGLSVKEQFGIVPSPSAAVDNVAKNAVIVRRAGTRLRHRDSPREVRSSDQATCSDDLEVITIQTQFENIDNCVSKCDSIFDSSTNGTRVSKERGNKKCRDEEPVEKKAEYKERTDKIRADHESNDAVAEEFEVKERADKLHGDKEMSKEPGCKIQRADEEHVNKEYEDKDRGCKKKETLIDRGSLDTCHEPNDKLRGAIDVVRTNVSDSPQMPLPVVTRRVNSITKRERKIVDANNSFRVVETVAPSCGLKSTLRRVKVLSPQTTDAPLQFVEDSQQSSERTQSATEYISNSDNENETNGRISVVKDNPFFYTSPKNSAETRNQRIFSPENISADSDASEQKSGLQANGNVDKKTCASDAEKKKNSDQPISNLEIAERPNRKRGLVAAPSVIPSPKNRRLQQSLTIHTPPSRRQRTCLSSSIASPKIKRNAKGETPLHVACIKNNAVKVEELLIAGANPNIKDYAGWTPLHEAVNHGYIDVARLLLDHHALINIPGADNESPLHDAVSNRRIDCIRLLVSRGADTHVRNAEGLTPRDLARDVDVKEALDEPVCQDASQTNMLIPVSRAEKMVILTTGLKREQREMVEKCAEMLDAELVSDFSHQVTHVITGVNEAGHCPRTLKYLNAVLTGKWMLNINWITRCLETQDLVDEEEFEVHGNSSFPDSMAPRKGRLNVEKQLPGLFDGMQFYLHGNFTHPSNEELITLVKNGGATILSREPKLDPFSTVTPRVPYHCTSENDLAKCCTFIVHQTPTEGCFIRDRFLCTVPATWITDCVATFSLYDLPGI